MPNGVDKNLDRLAIACAEFRAQRGDWPTEARLAPIVIWDFGQLFDLENFERLFLRLRIRATKHAHIAVGSGAHHLVYEKLTTNPPPERVAEALAWLGVRVRDDLRHE